MQNNHKLQIPNSISMQSLFRVLPLRTVPDHEVAVALAERGGDGQLPESLRFVLIQIPQILLDVSIDPPHGIISLQRGHPQRVSMTPPDLLSVRRVCIRELAGQHLLRHRHRRRRLNRLRRL